MPGGGKSQEEGRGRKQGRGCVNYFRDQCKEEPPWNIHTYLNEGLYAIKKQTPERRDREQVTNLKRNKGYGSFIMDRIYETTILSTPQQRSRPPTKSALIKMANDIVKVVNQDPVTVKTVRDENLIRRIRNQGPRRQYFICHRNCKTKKDQYCLPRKGHICLTNNC